MPDPALSETEPSEEPLGDFLRVDGEERSVFTRVGLMLLSLVLVVVGVVFWLVPVVTGVPFYVMAAITMGMASKRVARLVNAGERKLPRKLRRWLRHPRLHPGRTARPTDTEVEEDTGEKEGGVLSSAGATDPETKPAGAAERHRPASEPKGGGSPQ